MNSPDKNKWERQLNKIIYKYNPHGDSTLSFRATKGYVEIFENEEWGATGLFRENLYNLLTLQREDLIEQIKKEVIGEDEKVTKYVEGIIYIMTELEEYHRNQLRTEQRIKLSKLSGEGK